MPEQFEVEVHGFSGNIERNLQRLLSQARSVIGDSCSEQSVEGRMGLLTFTSREAAEAFVGRCNRQPTPDGTAHLQLRLPEGASQETDGDPESTVPETIDRPATAEAQVARPAATGSPRSVLLDYPEGFRPDPRFARSGSSAASNSDERTSAPYAFVPFRRKACLTAAPVLHDADQPGLWTGELQLTMTTLTPTLVGNDQYPISRSPQLLQKLEALRLERFTGQPQGAPAIDPAKPVLEPLTLSTPGTQEVGPVLIPGSGPHGMLRNSLSSLFAAPLERVAERTFSFRPNAYLGSKGTVRNSAPVLITHGTGTEDGRFTKLTGIRLGLNNIGYIHPDALPESVTLKLGRLWTADRRRLYAEGNTSWLQESRLDAGDIRKIREHGARLTMARIVKPGTSNRELDKLERYVVVPNCNGVDLAGELNRIHHDRSEDLGELENKSREGYTWMLVELGQQKQTVTIGPDQLREYYRSVEHYADADDGHLREHPLLTREGAAEVRSGIQQRYRQFLQTGLRPGHVIFLELHKQGEPLGPLGHHVYHRQRYRDSVHLAHDPELQKQHELPGPSTLRDVLCPRPIELQADDHGTPRGLSMARQMFGYVGTTQGRYDKGQPLTCGLGMKDHPTPEGTVSAPSDFSQLAGRVAFNMAIEAEWERKPLEQRFLNAGQQCLVPLRILGSPKPSAAEHYLEQDPQRIGRRQDAGELSTWGDTPHDPSAGQLRGRKHYLHQPPAASAAHGYELGIPAPPGACRSSSWRMEEDQTAFSSQQAMVARFVSKPGTDFRLTLRLTRMHLWELGALLLTLVPTRELWLQVADGLGDAGEPIRKWMADQSGRNQPLLAHKIGHARPLGLGSMQFRIDGIRRLSNPADGENETTLTHEIVDELLPGAIAALAEQLLAADADPISEFSVSVWAEEVVPAWLAVHRFAGRGTYDYPRPRQGGIEIFNYHSALHREHAEKRKRPAPTGSRTRHGLRDATEIP